MQQRLKIKRFDAPQPYIPTWEAMQAFTQTRTFETPDEIWLLEHESVFTQGLAGKVEHLLIDPGAIPVVRTDRGGQITYHGPGQLLLYCLLDLKRHALGIRALVTLLEQSVIAVLKEYGIDAHSRPEAPGVYIDQNKIASVGLRVRRGCTYHGIAVNLDMDLSPFHCINPCGFSGLKMTHLRDHVPPTATISRTHVESQLLFQLQKNLAGHD